MNEAASTTTAALAVAAVTLCTLWWWRWSRRPSGTPPGPGRRLPFLGHLHLLTKDPRVPFREWRQRYGDVFSLYLGSQLVVVLNGYDVIKEALVKNADAFSDRPHNNIQRYLSEAQGVGDTSGRVWKVQRKAMLEIMREMGLGKNILARKVGEEVGEFTKALSNKNGLPFDPSRLIQVSVSNNICSVAFGKRFEYDDPHFSMLLEAIDDLLKIAGSASVVNFLPFLRHFPGDVCGLQNAIKNYNHIVDTFLIPVIQQHIKDYSNDDHNDFISAYLREIKRAPERGLDDIVTEFNLQKMIMDLFVAGTDTTSTGIRWAVIYLLHHPDIQERCHQEIIRTIGTSRAPELTDRPNMPFLEAIMMETLRIADIAPLGVVHSSSCEVQFRGFTIPQGAHLIPNLNSVLRDPAVWKDPDVFRPDRFLDAEGKVMRTEQLIPFSIGRRVCLGESMARMELFLYLATMIQRFRFLPPEDGQLPSLEGIVGLVHSPKPFSVRAVPRV